MTAPDYADDIRTADQARGDVHATYRHLRAIEVNCAQVRAGIDSATVQGRRNLALIGTLESRVERALKRVAKLEAFVNGSEAELVRAQEGALGAQLEASVRAVADTERPGKAAE